MTGSGGATAVGRLLTAVARQMNATEVKNPAVSGGVLYERGERSAAR
jgi:hypothetical protein